MGFSVSGATVVVLIGVLVCAATVYPVLDRTAERRTEAVDAARERALDRQNTAIGGLTTTYDAVNDTLTIVVENRGAYTLAVSAISLLVDGRYVEFDASVAGDRSTNLWLPGESLTLTVSRTSAPTRVKVVTGPGVAAGATVGGS
jgi:flagellar protein FlaF